MSRDAERIAIAVCTRRRPRMLSDLMTSLQSLDVPQGSELLFLFVENDVVLSISEQVSEFSKWTGWQARAVHAADSGLVHARNAAVDAAVQEGAHWLAFVDDDEQVRHDWLRTLWAGAREAGAQLAGGPVRPVAPSIGCSDTESSIMKYYERAAGVTNSRNEAAARAKKPFDLATNNWIADLRALDGAGLRFDVAFNLSGGEDSDLSRRAQAAGLKLAWVPSAIVTEEMSPERLKAAYVFERARDQTMTKLRLRRADHRNSTLDVVGRVLVKAATGASRIVVSPIMGRYHYYRGLRSLGIATGYWFGLKGLGQTRYKQVTGE